MIDPYYSELLYGLRKLYFGRSTKMTDEILQALNARSVKQQYGEEQLSLHHKLHTLLSKLDPDLCYYSGIRYKSELDDCGLSVDGREKGNGWKIRISWDMETTTLWSPNLRVLLDAALEFIQGKIE